MNTRDMICVAVEDVCFHCSNRVLVLNAHFLAKSSSPNHHHVSNATITKIPLIFNFHPLLFERPFAYCAPIVSISLCVLKRALPPSCPSSLIPQYLSPIPPSHSSLVPHSVPPALVHPIVIICISVFPHRKTLIMCLTLCPLLLSTF